MQVAFAFLCVIDNGLSLIERAERVREDCQGRGISSKLSAHAQEVCGSLAKFDVASFNDKTDIYVQRAKAGRYNIIFYRVCVKPL